MSGYCSMARRESEAMPRRVIAIAMAIAKIGRRMKNSAIVILIFEGLYAYPSGVCLCL